MNRSLRFRPTLEALEHRACPAFFAGLSHGNLLITATEATFLEVYQLDADSFLVGEYFSGSYGFTDGVTGDVIIRLSDQDDIVYMGFNEHTTPDDVSIDLGGGINYLELGLYGGTIGGDLAILGGAGRDQVLLGDSQGGGQGLRVNGYSAIFTGQGNDQLTMAGGYVQFLQPAVIHLGGGDDIFENYSGWFHQPAYIHLGDGNDAFLNFGQFSQRSFVLGGSGTDTYVGSSTNVIKHGFEIANP